MSDDKAEDSAEATVERIAREWADADVKDCAFSAEAQARLWPGLYGMTTRSTARVLAALKPGDVLPGDKSGRLVVVREVVAEKPGSGEPLPSWLCSRPVTHQEARDAVRRLVASHFLQKRRRTCAHRHPGPPGLRR